MDAVSEADLVVVTDTGSSDATIERLRARGAIVHTALISPWRFDTARNVAMDHIPQDMDICVSNDLDEIFEPGWREKLETAWQNGHTRARYQFIWSHGKDAGGFKQYPMEKIHSRHGYRWIHPVHEVLAYSGPGPENTVVIPTLILHHYPDMTKPRSQYLPLLELSAQENPLDDRVAFWLGREYSYYGLHDKCIAQLTRYLAMPCAVWGEERCAAMRLIAACHREKGEMAAARKWLFRAAGECPGVREPYLDLAKFGYMLGDWPLTFFAVSEGLKITRQSGSYLLEPQAWSFALYDLGAVACYRLGLYEQARAFAALACSAAPEDARLKRNLELIEEKLKQVKESHAV